MANGRQMSTEEFIKKAGAKHSWKYDYSKVVYTKAKEKVCIICPIHGEFWQKADKHMNEGCGCPKCAGNIKFTTEDFIKEAKKVHGDKYDYSKVNYINNHTKVCIIDKDAGEFWQLPTNHLNGRGCHKNYGKRVWDTRGRITTDEFIERAKKVHGDKYDYSFADYKDMATKTKIKCKKCGRVFLQTPNNHINQKNGCPFCKSSKLENEVEETLIKNNIAYIREAGKKVLPWIGKQRLDFYLVKHKIGIECQGIQHYEPVKEFGGEARFRKQIESDNEKKKLCDENNVRLLYYTKYNTFGKNILKNKKSLIERIEKCH